MIVNAEFPVLVGGRFGIYERMREPLIELLNISGAGGMNDRAVYCWPSDHPQNLSGDQDGLRDADVIVCIDDRHQQCHGNICHPAKGRHA